MLLFFSITRLFLMPGFEKLYNTATARKDPSLSNLEPHLGMAPISKATFWSQQLILSFRSRKIIAAHLVPLRYQQNVPTQGKLDGVEGRCVR